MTSCWIVVHPFLNIPYVPCIPFSPLLSLHYSLYTLLCDLPKPTPFRYMYLLHCLTKQPTSFNIMFYSWSYGVFVHELFSGGETPYVGKSLVEVATSISAGERMGKHEYVPYSVYDVMLDCWSSIPKHTLCSMHPLLITTLSPPFPIHLTKTTHFFQHHVL